MVDLAGPFLDSLLLGSLYTIMAIGLTITYKVTRIPNFAHAELGLSCIWPLWSA